MRNTYIGIGILLLGGLGPMYIYFTGAYSDSKSSTDTSEHNADLININVDIPEDELKVPLSKKSIYALGDSLTAGYRLPLEESYPSQLEKILKEAGYRYTVINGGQSGDTSSGLLNRLDRILQDAQSGDIAIVVIGANDGMRSLSLNTLEANIADIIDILQEKGLEVVLGGMQVPTNLAPSYREDFSAIYPRLARVKNVTLIPFFLENVAAIPELNLSDGIHPTQEGYEIIARQTKEYLVEKEIVIKE